MPVEEERLLAGFGPMGRSQPLRLMAPSNRLDRTTMMRVTDAINRRMRQGSVTVAASAARRFGLVLDYSRILVVFIVCDKNCGVFYSIR